MATVQPEGWRVAGSIVPELFSDLTSKLRRIIKYWSPRILNSRIISRRPAC